MIRDELIELIDGIVRRRCESQHIELKSAHDGAPRRLYPTLSSFSNQDGGGAIIFGIDESNGFNVTGVYDAQDLQKKVFEQANQMEPVVRPLFTVVDIDGKLVVSAEIPELPLESRPCFYRGTGRMKGSFVRVGEADQGMTEYEIYSYEAYRRRVDDELRIVERGSLDHFDENLTNNFLTQFRQQKQNLSHMDDTRLLEMQGMLRKAIPTIAGLMVLGTYPQEFFPQLCITAIVVDGTEVGNLSPIGERFIDNQKIGGSIESMLDQTISFIRRNMRVSTFVNEMGKRVDSPDYPIIALREALVNAMMHRDYSMHTERSPVRVILYTDRLEIENPGGLYGRITLNNLGKVAADTRNPFIAAALEILKVAENRYSGIPTIRHELHQAGLAEPEFINNRGSFKVVFRKREPMLDSLDVIQRQILSYCRTPRTKDELSSNFGYETPSYFFKNYVQPLVELGLLHPTIPEKPRSRYQKFVTHGV